jgi:hypothetical protein
MSWFHCHLDWLHRSCRCRVIKFYITFSFNGAMTTVVVLLACFAVPYHHSNRSNDDSLFSFDCVQPNLLQIEPRENDKRCSSRNRPAGANVIRCCDKVDSVAGNMPSYIWAHPSSFQNGSSLRRIILMRVTCFRCRMSFIIAPSTIYQFCGRSQPTHAFIQALVARSFPILSNCLSLNVGWVFIEGHQWTELKSSAHHQLWANISLQISRALPTFEFIFGSIRCSDLIISHARLIRSVFDLVWSNGKCCRWSSRMIRQKIDCCDCTCLSLPAKASWFQDKLQLNRICRSPSCKSKLPNVKLLFWRALTNKICCQRE